MSSEHDLLEAFREHADGAAFAELVRRTSGMVYATCRRVLDDAQLAHDATQETFLQLVKDPRAVTGSVGAWLHRVATNKALDVARREGRLHRRQERAVRFPVEVEQWSELSALIDEALAQLDEQPRALLVRHYLAGVGQAQLAAEHGCSQSTMSRRLVEAMESLRAQLRRLGVAVSVAVLASGLSTATAVEVPPALAAEIGKMGLAAAAKAIPKTLSLAWIATAALIAIGLAGLTLIIVRSGHSTRAVADPPAAPLAAPERKAMATMPAQEDPTTIDQALVMRAVDAIWSGDTATLSRLLREHPALARARVASDQGHYRGYFFHATLLHHVAGNPTPDGGPIRNAVESARILLAAGAEVDARTGVGPAQPDATTSTTLALATSAGDALGDQCGPLVDLLVAAGADVNDSNGNPMGGALYYKAWNGVRALLDHHAKLDACFAANVGDLAMLRSFFDADGKLLPDAVFLNRDGRAAPPPSDERGRLAEILLFACNGRAPDTINGRAPDTIAVVDFLLAHGADAKAAVNGDTPLHLAAWNGDLALVRLLLEHGGDPKARDQRYHATPADWAEHNRQGACADLLRTWPAEPAEPAKPTVPEPPF
jgi:RNA polymerase sigma factor (sigma-70 family)